LITRSGKLIGMISTHWAKPHRPLDRSLRMLDILARSTADLIERRRSAETQRLLLNELNHRVKNTLAVVQAMAQRTLAKSNDPKAFAKSFGGRIEALARAHNMLSAKSWQSADLREMIGDQLLLGAVDASRLAMSGPDVRLDAQSALHMALVLHELGTNATKYGGLSLPDGRVSIDRKADDRLRIVWMERGGPHVAPCSAKGFGTTLIAQSVKGQGGDAQMIIEPTGIIWRIDLPLGSCTVSENPAVLPRVRPDTSWAPGDASSLAGRRFLVVEDEPLIGLDIVAALEDAGVVVEGPVGTVDEACDLIERLRFDGALLDVSLYGRPVDAIAAALTYRKVPFAFVTGHNSDGLPEGFQAVPIIGKPCRPEAIIGASARMMK